MLRRLLKYDFRCMIKQFALVWPAALAVALINCFLNTRGNPALFDNENSVKLVFMLIFVGVMIAMAVISAVFVITRFNSGLLRDEGYLMFTLPVKPRQLILSKLITAMTVIIVSCVVAVINILLLSAAALDWSVLIGQLDEIWGEFARWIAEYPQWILVMAEAILAGVLSVAGCVLLIYFAISVGHLFNRHRVAASVIAYVLISALANLIMNTIIIAMADTGVFEWMQDLLIKNGGSYPFTLFAFGAIIAMNLVYCAAYFFGTNYILSRKLNLE